MEYLQNGFVPYELALKLKELGFNEKSFGYYTKYKEFFYFDVDDLSSAYTKNMDNLIVNSVDELECTAPTLSQAFRWFREKYGLYSCINIFTEELGNEKVYFTYEIRNPEQFELSETYKTYEEAELACLTKLIEIVENK